MDLLVAEAAVLVILLLGHATLDGQSLALLGEFLEADNLGLIGLQETLIGTAQPVQTDTQPLLTGGVLPGLCGLRDKSLELCQQLGGIAEQADDMVPHRLFERVGVNPRPGAPRLATGRQRIRSGTAVIALACPPPGRREKASMDAQPAGAALQQAAQQVMVLLVATERQRGVAAQPGLGVIPSLLVDQCRHRDGDPLLTRPRAPAAPLPAAARLALATWLSRHDVLVAVGIGRADVHRV
jgi:hypothetical protein